MQKLIDIVLKALALAMGVSVVILARLGELTSDTGFFLLGLGLACLASASIQKR